MKKAFKNTEVQNLFDVISDAVNALLCDGHHYDELMKMPISNFTLLLEKKKEFADKINAKR
jgi:hypothetical protein